MRQDDLASIKENARYFPKRVSIHKPLVISAIFAAILLLLQIILQFQPLVTIGSFIAFLCVCWYLFIKQAENTHSTQFQAALFAATAATKPIWYVIIREEDGQIIYASPKSQQFFKTERTMQPNGVLGLLEQLNLDTELWSNTRKRKETISQQQPIQDLRGMVHHGSLELTSLKRPEGFWVLHYMAREIVNTQSTHSTNHIEESLWEDILETAPIPLIQLDENGFISRNNKAFSKLTGKTHMNGWQLMHLADETTKTAIKEAFNQAKQSGEAVLANVPMVFGQYIDATVFVFIQPIQTHKKRFLVYLIDASEHQALEQRFIQAQKMQAVGQLAGGIAHDFNNLLTAMIGFCDLLLARHVPGDASFPDIMQVKQNANRASNLVRQLLAFSRKQTLQPEVIDLTESLADLSNLLRRLLGEPIALNIKHGRNLCPICVDEGQFEQVIVNLAVNARDAMKEGGELTITTENITISDDNPVPKHYIGHGQNADDVRKGDYVVITMNDTGSGIPDHVMPQIFEPFYTTKNVGEGTGLGLSTVYGIIEQTGGNIFVTSNDKGTSFRILLPKHVGKASEKASDVVLKGLRDNEAPSLAPEKPSATPTIKSDLTGNGTILLVEDEVPVRLFSSRALTNKGYTVIEAEDGETALHKIEQHGDDIDLIISDVMMPGISGADMVAQALETYPDMNVMFISGYGEDAFEVTRGNNREFHFLPKPFDLEKLASKVKEILG